MSAAANNITSSPLPSPYIPTGCHFVGSVNLPTAHDVFITLSSTLPGRLRRIPDGETGDRQNFIWFQRAVFANIPQVLRQYNKGIVPIPPSEARQADIDTVLATIKARGGLPSTQYDSVAIESYSIFAQLQQEGQIEKDVKFQVSLPTPINALTMVAPAYQVAIYPHYEAILLQALQNIQNAIPHDKLAVQFDVASEFAMLEGVLYPHYTTYFGTKTESELRDAIVQRIVRLVNEVEVDVDMGLHLCYGDLHHEHFIQPRDMGLMVDVAQRVIGGCKEGRRLDFLHFPVPKDRTDTAYFVPLKQFLDRCKTNKGKEAANLEIYLGLVHHNDEAGTRQRIAAAAEVLQESRYGFGVATECGFGRTPKEETEGILSIMRDVSGECVSS